MDMISVSTGYCVLDVEDYQLHLSKGRVASRLVATAPTSRSEFLLDVLLCLSSLGVCPPPVTGRVVDLSVGPDPRLSTFERCGCALITHVWGMGFRLSATVVLPSSDQARIHCSAEAVPGQSWAQVEALKSLGVKVPADVEDEAAVASSVCLVNGWPVGYSANDGAWTWLSR